MFIFDRLRISTFTLSFLLILPPITCNNEENPKKQVSKVASGDTEAELLDQEYGVRYASACEGKNQEVSLSRNCRTTIRSMSTNPLAFCFNYFSV